MTVHEDHEVMIYINNSLFLVHRLASPQIPFQVTVARTILYVFVEANFDESPCVGLGAASAYEDMFRSEPNHVTIVIPLRITSYHI